MLIFYAKKNNKYVTNVYIIRTIRWVTIAFLDYC